MNNNAFKVINKLNVEGYEYALWGVNKHCANTRKWFGSKETKRIDFAHIWVYTCNGEELFSSKCGVYPDMTLHDEDDESATIEIFAL